MSGATPLGNMVIKLGLDDADFGRGVTNSKKQVGYLAKEMSANMKIADMAGDKLGKLGTKYESLTKIIGAQEKQVAALKKAYDESFVDGKATDSTKRLASQLQDANGKLASYQTQLKNTAGDLAELQVKTTGVTGSINKYSDKLISSGKKIESFGNGLIKGVTVPLAAAVTAVTTAAISWESDFAGVKKTNDEIVDSTGKVVYSYKDLEDGLRELATELPSTHKEIAAVAEAGGQLGIATDDVVSFTKVMLDMGESTNLAAETAATELARFANITGMSHDKFSNLGSAIVDLGNNFATTESEISAMSLRLAGAGSQIGMSEGEILGFAAALSSVGVEAEAGGSAFSKVMIQMQLAVEKGTGAFTELEETANAAGYTIGDVGNAVSKGGNTLKGMAEALGTNSSSLKKWYKEADKSKSSLENFSNVAGVTSEEFSKMFKSNPSEAIMKFVEGLSHAEEKGTSAIKVLDDMDIKEVRLRDSLLRAAGASGTFGDAIAMGNKAFKENTALTAEANKRYETTESKLKMLRNEAKNAAIDLGGPFVDALRDGLNSAKPLIKSLGDLAKKFSDADPKTQQMILKLGAFAMAAGPVLSITGKLTSGIGGLGKSFVEMSAQMAKKKAIAEVSKQLVEGSVSVDTLTTALGGGVKKFALFGGAASSAAGSSGLGAMAATLGPLGPAILGIVGVGGALAVGYGAWKLFGEEAWNSSQRVQRWGSDVGEVVDETLTEMKGHTEEAGGQFSLLEQGISENTGNIVSNFSKMGESIENNLVNKITTLKELVNKLPEDVRAAGEEFTKEEVSNQEKYLKTVQDNNEKITQIRQNASNNNRQITYEETVRIKALAEESATAYVESLGKSEKETKEILSAMTGNVEEASKDQAKSWLQNLGKQRQDSKLEYGKMQKDLENELVNAGYDLNSTYAKDMLKLLETSGNSATQITEDQMSLILGKYPELANEVWLANGQLVSSMGEAGTYAIQQNKQMMKSFSDMSDKASESAEKNKEKLKLILDETESFGSFWNDLVFDPKTGEVKTNAQEEVNKAAKSEQGWNQLMWISKDADVSSNVKTMIAEAAIANGKWDSLTFTEQQAMLETNAQKTFTQAIQVNGDWENMSFEEKKAILYSNTPEKIAETMFSLGIWDNYEPLIKDLEADNYDFLNALSQSEEKLKDWNSLDNDAKSILGDNQDFLDKIYLSEEKFNQWKSIPADEKRMLANNTDLLEKLVSSKESLEGWNGQTVEAKYMLANNEDLANKVFSSSESLSSWNNLPVAIKAMLADNLDILSKVDDGTISIEEYNEVLPLLKKLLGDSSNIKNESKSGATAIDTYNGKTPILQKFQGDASSAVKSSSTGIDAINRYTGNTPGVHPLIATDNASGPAWNASNAVEEFSRKRDHTVTLTSIVKNVTQWISEKINKNATGTNFHPGGHMLVNDQEGPLYEELVTFPDGTSFIPKGRDVLIPNAPVGAKVLKASLTKRLIPRYADGVGIPQNAQIIKQMQTFSSSSTRNQNLNINVDQTELINVVQSQHKDMMSVLKMILQKNPNIELDGNILNKVQDSVFGNKLSRLMYGKG